VPAEACETPAKLSFEQLYLCLVRLFFSCLGESKTWFQLSPGKSAANQVGVLAEQRNPAGQTSLPSLRGRASIHAVFVHQNFRPVRKDCIGDAARAGVGVETLVGNQIVRRFSQAVFPQDAFDGRVLVVQSRQFGTCGRVIGDLRRELTADTQSGATKSVPGAARSLSVGDDSTITLEQRDRLTWLDEPDRATGSAGRVAVEDAAVRAWQPRRRSANAK